MKTMSLSTHWSRTSALARGLTLAAMAAGAWALSAGLTQAHANDVYWSVGINQPGVSVGVSNAPPVMVHQYPTVRHHPVVVNPYPVVQHRPVVVYPQPVVVHQPYPYVRPVVMAPQPVYVQGWGHSPRWDDRRDRRHPKWQKRHDRHDRYDRYDNDDRYGRGDDDHRGNGRR